MSEQPPSTDTEAPLSFQFPREVSPKELSVIALSVRSLFVKTVLMRQRRIKDVVTYTSSRNPKYEEEVGLQLVRLPSYEKEVEVEAGTKLEFIVPQDVEEVVVSSVRTVVETMLEQRFNNPSKD